MANGLLNGIFFLFYNIFIEKIAKKNLLFSYLYLNTNTATQKV